MLHVCRLNSAAAAISLPGALLIAALAALADVQAAVTPPAPPPEWIHVHAPNLENQTARPLRYRPDGADFVIENGPEFFNRPLYCLNTAFRVDGGDKPEFSIYVPGRGGNLRFGIKTSAGLKWLNDADHITTRYRPGSLIYEIRDPLMGNRELHLTVLPLNDAKGIIVRAELPGAGQPAELLWAFGGANGERGRRAGDIGCEREPISQFFQLRPEQCRGNAFSIATNTFVLRSRVATILGIAPPGATLAVADATQWASPADLWTSAGRSTDLPLLAGRVGMTPGSPVFLTLQQIGTNETIEAWVRRDPAAAFAAAEAQRQAIAGRVVVETPDAFINAAAAALNVAGNAIWDEPQGAYMHGAVAWRSKLLGWRGPYTGDALGWHDRARRHLAYWSTRQNTNPVPDRIPPADPTVNLTRNEPALHSNGALSHSHYDMNLVYIDALFRHLLWTGDLEFAREVWPVIERHLAWERRLFRREFGPDKLPLYEAYAAIWASDDLQYHGGGVTHASAYNYWHNLMTARVAKLLGKDAAPYEREAELIARAMREHLWLGDRGWFAEWKDYLGLQLAHPSAALWTFYHTMDSELTTPLEAWQMTRFVDTQIARIPIHGPGVPEGNFYTLPTTSWMPYFWSINNVVMAEVAHTSLAYWQAGRPEEAFNLFKSCLLDSMFMGLCPGNVGMTTYFDMARREAQRDFGDSVGISSRTMVEGLFGVQPDAFAGELRVRPGFPAAWDKASIRHPDFAITFNRTGLSETYAIESRFSKPMKLRLQPAALRTGIARVEVNGRPATWRALEDSVGQPRIEIQTAPAARQEVVIVWKGGKPAAAKAPEIAARDRSFRAEFGDATLETVADPQQALKGRANSRSAFDATPAGIAGHRTVLAKLHQGDVKWWSPVTFEIRLPFEIIAAETQDETGVRFRVRNNTPAKVDAEKRTLSVPDGKKTLVEVPAIPAFGESPEISLPAAPFDLLPGSTVIAIELGTGRSARGTIVNWKLPMPSARSGSVASGQTPGMAGPEQGPRCETIPLSLFNDRVTQIFRNDYLSPRSPFCSLALPKHGLGGWCDYAMEAEIDDSGLRRAAAEGGGRFVGPQGIPFQTPAEPGARNIAFTSQWDNYPRELSTPLSGSASRAYLLMAGSSNPMQSRFDNGEVVVTYQDGSTERLALHNPTTWWSIDQDYFIDDFAFRRPDPIPPRVDLRTGKVRLLDAATFKGTGGKVPGGAANILDLPLNPQKELKSLTVRTLANEVVIGLMAVTLVR